MPESWSEKEVSIIIADYFEMLKKELMGESYFKAHHRRNLLPLLNNRSDSSIEFKRRNISAVLLQYGVPPIPGYKPAFNFQKLLFPAIEKYLEDHPGFREYLNHDLNSELLTSIPDSVSGVEVQPPILGDKGYDGGAMGLINPKGLKINYLQREIDNRKLGLVGEEFVVHYERKWLQSIGKGNFSRRVEHVSKERGDGFGFDVLSYDEHGNEKFIEVKSTKWGKETPFYFSRNELDFSQKNSNNFYLYRVFGLRKNPQFYVLKGALNQTSNFNPTQFMGFPKGI